MPVRMIVAAASSRVVARVAGTALVKVVGRGVVRVVGRRMGRAPVLVRIAAARAGPKVAGVPA